MQSKNSGPVLWATLVCLSAAGAFLWLSGPHGQANDLQSPNQGVAIKNPRIFALQRVGNPHGQIPIPEEQIAKLRLSRDCSVEIEQISTKLRETRVYVKGRLVSRSSRAIPEGGRDRDGAALPYGAAGLPAEELWEPDPQRTITPLGTDGTGPQPAD